ncbi:putative baseplate assembly protein [Falsiroseomonas bella]|uniref:Putative baseplate assembly protein n=1 Tax=Falsiroseomonas bella TaxID=2184016 RepID=A0A317FIY7_9PROT|nr:putative baseplate assembly protein [Falsiroseomonas bella]PWS37598.1 putative baseplate assembly protein [Falsiroseomonas bella]
MAIQPPRLDDRSWQDLRDELVRRIPVHAPEWTDHSPTDPGVTLIELFAFLGDNLLYRLNRAPEAAKLAFLKLLNLPPRPAIPARVQLRLMLPKGGIDAETPDFSPTAPRLECAAGPVSFEADEEITVLPLEVAGFVKARHDEAVPAEGTEAVTQLLESHLGSAPGTLSAYQTVPMPAVQGGVLPAPTSSAGTLDGRLWLCLLAPEDALAALAPRTPAEALAVLRERISGRILNLGVRTDDALCGPADVLRCPDPGTAATPWPVRAEISTGRFHGASKRVDRAAFERLSIVDDRTEGLTRSGTLRLRLPDMRGGVPVLGDWTEDSFDPPDPDLLGVGPLPPRLDDPKQAARVLAWVSLRRIEAAHPPIRLRLVEGNGLSATQAVTAAPELLGHGDGRPAQMVRLSKAPMLQDSELVQVRGTLGWEKWTRVDDLALGGPDDPVYLLDPVEGTITFGDGLHGRMPLPGEAIRCLGYRAGGGARGNVPAMAVSRVKNARVGLRCENSLPAEGGQDAETIPEATARIPRTLRTHDRAVAAEDFVEIALETPGRKVGRAHVLPRHKPQQRADGVPGTVTVVVLPAHDPVTPDTPTPDREMLRRVCAHLEPRRLVTTELYVTPPEYVPVDLSVAVEAEPGTGGETLKRWVELALRQHFAPLPPYGPDGAGWPFGRAVRDRDAEAAALRVQGVRLVNEVLLEGEAIGADGENTPVTGSVPMLAWQLPVIRSVRVAIGEKAEEIAPEPTPPVDGMPVPVEVEKC